MRLRKLNHSALTKSMMESITPQWRSKLYASILMIIVALHILCTAVIFRCMKSYMHTQFPCYKNSSHKNTSCSKEERYEMSKLQGIGEAEVILHKGQYNFVLIHYLYSSSI